MTKPQIIRADSIDLQDTDAPSAKDHKTRSKVNGSSTSLAPHQAETIREVLHEAAEENHRSPRLSWANGEGDNFGDLSQYAEDLAAGVNSRLGGSDADVSEDKMQREDNSAVAQNGGLSGKDDDSDADGDTDESLDDDMMDKISSSPSIEDEDIDFEFVYALHTFVATVEGQANATKGDTMVLLDDSNSYWWLVRVVKDSSIGYLPAEHIETPTERLARLNKHRNIDLSATMLQDQSAEKSKPGLRSALRAKKRKAVTFSEPTYVDYSDYSSDGDDEDGDELFGPQPQAQQDGAQQQDAPHQQQSSETAAEQAQSAADEETMDDETAKVEPLKPRAQKDTSASDAANEMSDDEEARRSSEQFFENKPDGVSRSRNGTVRNTDSFFKDDTVETKKITLTPNLLRDDNQPRPSNDSSKEQRQRPSLDKAEKLERELQSEKKDDRKKKDKKPSAIRSFFSRKDKKRGGDEDDDSLGKRSMETFNEEQDEDLQASPDKSSGPQRNPSKLQKPQPRSEPPPTNRPGSAPQKSTTRELAEYIASEGRTNDVSNVPPASMRIVHEQDSPEPADASQESSRSASRQKEERSGPPKAKPTRSESGEKLNKMEKPQKVIKAKSRVELDDFDSSDEGDSTSPADRSRQLAAEEDEQQQAGEKSDGVEGETQLRPQLPGAFPDSFSSAQTTSSTQSDQTVKGPASQPAASASVERLPESPIQASAVQASNPPALVTDTSSQEDQSSHSPSPEPIDTEDSARHQAQDSFTTTSTSTGGNAWNDAKLRAFFDSSSDTRDMLIMVYDRNDVAPAGPDHPVAGSLFREQNAKLAEITTQLDNMLGDWLARKQRLRGTV